MQYDIDNLTADQERLVHENLSNLDVEEAYDAMLRETYGNRRGNIDICGTSYDAPYALREVDPTAYRVGLADFEGDLEERGYMQLATFWYSVEEVEELLDNEPEPKEVKEGDKPSPASPENPISQDNPPKNG